MSIEPKEVDLDWEGRRCVVHELGAKDARGVARRISNIIGAGIRASATSEKVAELDLQVAAIVAGGAVLEQLDDATVEWLTQTFMRQTLIEREAGTEDFAPLKDVEALVFAGGAGLRRWWRWIRFCVEMTCGDFFADAIVSLRRRVEMPAATTPAPTTMASTSPSTSTRSGSFTA